MESVEDFNMLCCKAYKKMHLEGENTCSCQDKSNFNETANGT